jgi:hypothetical protein
MFKIGMKNKQYGISFEVATSSNKVVIPKLSSCLTFLVFIFINNSSVRSLDNHLINND